MRFCLVLALAVASIGPARAENRSGLFASRTVAYEQRLDRIDLADANGKAEAMLLAPSFIAKSQDPRRPILFAFNGGPGSSSALLRLGMLGPERLDFADGATRQPTSLPLVHNAESPLDVADIVLIDPVGTGFSRLLDPSKRDAYYSTDGDGAYLARFIRAWLEQHGRLGSPVFLLGESYGADRAVQLAKYLSDAASPAVDLQGIVLLSESIGVLETVQRRGNVVGYAVGVPTMSAIAWYHGVQTGPREPLETYLRKVNAWIERDYLPALFAGRDIDPGRKDRVARQLAAFIGLPVDYILANDLRVTKEMHRAEMLRRRGLVTGRYDGRYVGPSSGPDPSLTWLMSATENALRTVYQGWPDPAGGTLDYRPTDNSKQRWTFARNLVTVDGSTYRQFDQVVDLMETMKRRPTLRLMVVGGYFDTTASVGADDYLLRQNAIPMDRTEVIHYPAGHMFYTDNDSRRRFAGALRNFISNVPPKATKS